MRKILFINFMLFLVSGCTPMSPTLDVKLGNYLQDNCKCVGDYCECGDTYGNATFLAINCSGQNVSSIGDIIKKCDYWNSIDGNVWKKGD